MTKEYSKNPTIERHRQFLSEELDVVELANAFVRRGKKEFGLFIVEREMGRQDRSEIFLSLIEMLQLTDMFIEILHELDMIYIYTPLENSRRAYSADPALLHRNIKSRRAELIDNLDVDDIRGVFIERGVISREDFDKIPDDENQLSLVLDKILRDQNAMMTLVDALFINGSDGLANSLLE